MKLESHALALILGLGLVAPALAQEEPKKEEPAKEEAAAPEAAAEPTPAAAAEATPAKEEAAAPVKELSGCAKSFSPLDALPRASTVNTVRPMYWPCSPP